MKKFTDKSSNAKAAHKRRRPCLMAYTLNNYQPVICTIIADQPYFYMEEENIADDDDILGLEEYAHFEEDMAELKKKMDAYERLAKNYERDPSRRLADFCADAKIITGEKQETAFEEILLPADRITALLSNSRMGQALLDCARTHSVYLVESEQVATARYDRESGRILIHPSLGEAEQCLLAVRELRRHWQHRKGVMIHPLTFHPDHAIVINRAQVADQTIAMIRVGWELQLAGQRDVWEHIENSALADLGRAFAREAFTDFRSLANGKASSAVFESWFLSERCRHQDKKLIQAMLADHQGYVFTNEDASRHVTLEMISALGEQPFGKNYLAPYAQAIIEDPVFTEVRDRSNANFLWFIKFERSFRETEQALQSGEELSGADILSAPSSQETGKSDHGASIIIPIKPGVIHRGERGVQGAFLETGDDSANVIHVRFGEGKSA
ncbi:MAG: hypothetical protein DI551_00115 [Micavibrio aeruginosavorus]|uniref:DUF6782 domain-containing protein n=1 Tax=Micavibrio aeruginosavorus TaxID=349221 RepID=A0A2W5N6F7_9BACT|nr:MAG: hypothetical protein DI551_00115 [Micavibrio aeruginosavorus]